MPLVRISVNGKTAEQRHLIGEAIHAALVSVASVPKDDLFQVFEETLLRVTPSYLGISHGKNVAIIQVFLNEGRTVEVKRLLYARLAEGVAAAAGIRGEDVIVSLVEVAKQDWSFGNGLMSYA